MTRTPDFKDITREELRALPIAKWNESIECFGFILLPDDGDELHDSGFRLIDIIALDENMKPFARRGGGADHIVLEIIEGLSSDCLPTSRAMRFWKWVDQSKPLQISEALSSVWIRSKP